MKTHTTNYKNTFIEAAEDCPVDIGQEPPMSASKKSIASHQFELLLNHPYQYDSDEVIFTVFVRRKGIEEQNWVVERQKFFSKGQPCLRASPLTKRYGWGIHSDENGKVAIYGVGTQAYKALVADPTIKKVKAMKSKR